MVQLVRLLQIDRLMNQDVARTNAAAATERLVAVRREREAVDAYLATMAQDRLTGRDGAAAAAHDRRSRTQSG